MPSDLTIKALQNRPSSTFTPKPREQRIIESHKKAASWQEQYPLQEMGIFGGAEESLVDRMKQSKFFETASNEGVTVATADEIQTVASNALGLALGITGDATKLVYNILESAPKGVSDTPLPNLDENFEPFTSESIAQRFGGDPEHWSWLPAALVTPGIGPGEIKFAIAASARAKKLAPGVKPLTEDIMTRLNGADPYDADIWKETGWYRAEDGEPRFWLPDNMATIKNDAITNHPFIARAKKEAVEDNREVYDFIEFRAQDVYKHDLLYEAYPQIANLKIKMGIKAKPDGKVFIEWRGKGPGSIGKMTRRDGMVNDVRVFNAELSRNPESIYNLKRILNHELQHVVQAAEGTAKGGAAKINLNDLDTWERYQRRKTAIDLIGGESLDNIDDVYKRLVEEGLTEADAQSIIADRQVQRYLAASNDADLETMFDMERDINMGSTRSERSILFALEYLSERGDITDFTNVELLNNLNKIGRFTDVNKLAHQAYQHKLGEAEARLAEVLSDMVPETVPNPNQLTDVDRPLSVERQRPQEVRQFTPPTEGELEGLVDVREQLRGVDIVADENRLFSPDLPEGTDTVITDPRDIQTLAEGNRGKAADLVGNELASFRNRFRRSYEEWRTTNSKQAGEDVWFFGSRLGMGDDEIVSLMEGKASLDDIIEAGNF